MRARIRSFFASTFSDSGITIKPPPMPVSEMWRMEFVDTLIHMGYSRRDSEFTFRELTVYLPGDEPLWRLPAGEAAEIMSCGFCENAPGVFSRRWLILQSITLLAGCAAALYFILP